MTPDPSEDGNGALATLTTKRQSGVNTLAAILVGLFITIMWVFYGNQVPVPRQTFAVYLICAILGMLVIGAGTTMIDDTVEAVRNAAAVRPARERTELPPWVYWVFVWSSSTAQFLALAFLVMQTGGLEHSPYVPILATSIALAPNAMNPGKFMGSIIVLWLFGGLLLATMAFEHPMLRELAQAPPSSMHFWMNFGTISIAIMVALGIKVIRRRHLG